MTNDELLHKWLENTISKEELNIFKKRPEYESLKTLYRRTEHMAGPSMDKEAMLKSILAVPKSPTLSTHNTNAKSHLPKNEPKVRSLSTWFKLGIAASVILVAGYFLFLTPTTQNLVSYQIAEGRIKKGKLPDGSKFTISGNSTISFDSIGWQKARTLNLEGEASFAVLRGTTFTVKTPDVSVEVLGTEFTVTSRGGDFEVKCKSGSVQVKGKNGKTEEVLKPGESVSMTKAGKFTNLRQDISRFKNVPLEEAMAILEKKFRIVFYNQNDIIDTKQLLTCNFQHNNLNQALKTTLSPLGIKYETFGPGQIRIFK